MGLFDANFLVISTDTCGSQKLYLDVDGTVQCWLSGSLHWYMWKSKSCERNRVTTSLTLLDAVRVVAVHVVLVDLKYLLVWEVHVHLQGYFTFQWNLWKKINVLTWLCYTSPPQSPPLSSTLSFHQALFFGSRFPSMFRICPCCSVAHGAYNLLWRV